MSGFFTRKNMRAALIFLVCLVLSLIFSVMYIQTKKQMEYALMNQLVLEKSNKVTTVISKLLYKTEMLAALVIQQNTFVNNFEKIAAVIVDDPAIKNVILAPDGIVSQVYPLKGNEAVIGLDYFKSGQGNTEAIAARDRGELILGGPFDLVQGGQALVGRLPVYVLENDTKRFMGLVSVTLEYPQALAGAELDQLYNRGLGYEIWRISPETNERQIIACSSYGYDSKSRFVEQQFNILNAQWFFRIAPMRAWYQYTETWIFLLVGIILSLLAATLVSSNYDLQQIKKELEFLTYNDPLTGILNRRGFFKEMQIQLDSANPRFILAYFDLDNFKKINDQQGHSIGNLALINFVNTLKNRINSSHVFARIGGDEFVLVFKNSDDKDTAQAFCRTAQKVFGQSTDLNMRGTVSLSFSMGFASYPTDAQTLEKVIGLADIAMYADKMEHKKTGAFTL